MRPVACYYAGGKDRERWKLMNRRGRWFYLILCVLLAFLIVPLCVSAAVFFNAMKVSNERMESSVSALLAASTEDARRSPLDGDFFVEAADYLEENGLVDDLMSEGGSVTESASEVQKRLEAIEGDVSREHGTPNRVLLYVADERLIVSSAGSERIDGQHSGLVGNLAASGLFDDIASLEVDRAKASTDQLVDEQGEKFVVRVQQFRPGVYLLYYKTGGPEEADLFQSVRAVDERAEAGFYDRFGNLHAYGDEAEVLGSLSYDDFGSEAEGSLHFEREGVSYIVCYSRFDNPDTIFAVVMEDLVAGAQRSALVSVTVAVAVLCVIGVAVAIAFSRRVYRPLERLLERFSGKKTLSMADNEFGVIAEGIESMDDLIKQQQCLIEKDGLRALLHGYWMDVDDESRYFFQCEGTVYALVGIRLDGAEALGGVTGFDTPRYEASVSAWVCESLSAQGFGPFTTVGDSSVTVAIVGMGARGYADLLGALESVKGQALVDGLYLSLLVSEQRDSDIDIAKAFEEIMQVLDYCRVSELYNVVMPYGSYRAEQPDRDTRDNLEMLGDLSRAVSAVSAVKALKSYDRLVRSYALDVREPSKAERDLALISSTICLALYSSRKAAYLPGGAADSLMAQIMHAGDAASLRSALEKALEDMDRLASKGGLDSVRFDEIEAFVRNNITNPDLSSALVARRFETSQPNITRMFKKYAGVGFLEYMHGLRIERAKELLDGSDATVADVAAAVGFTNALTMSRAFKRSLGITPTEYRKV